MMYRDASGVKEPTPFGCTAPVNIPAYDSEHGKKSDE